MDDREGYIRVMGIDPGSKTLGIAILDYNPDTGHLILAAAWTLTTNRAIQLDPARAEKFGNLFIRLEAIMEHLLHAMFMYRPDRVIAETSYMGRLAQAFSVLTQVFTAIRTAVRRYRSSMTLEGIDPASAKKMVGVPGNSNDKTLMLRAISSIKNLDNQSGIPYALMTDHTIDGIGVAHYLIATAFGFKASFL